MKSSNIGGQAVMEGVMMRNADKYAVAVRKTDGEIVVKTEEYKKRLIHEPGMKKLIKKPKNIIVFENEVSKNIELS